MWIAKLAALSLAAVAMLVAPASAQAMCKLPVTKHSADPSVRVTSSTELRNAIRALAAGGRKHIVVAPGEYQVLAGSYAIKTTNVTIRGETGRRDDVIIRGQGMTGRVQHVFSVHAPHFTLRDLTLGWVAYHGVQVHGEHNADYAKFINLRFVDTREQMLKVSADHSMPDEKKVGADFGVVSNSLFEFPAGVAQQYYTGGIDAHFATGWRIVDNEFRHIRSPGHRLAEHAVHFWRGSANTIVLRNRIFNADRGIGFGLNEDGAGHSGGLIRNNFIHVSRDVGIALESASNAIVSHNTVYVDGAYANAIEYRFSRTHDVTIAYNLTNREIRQRDGGEAELVGNVNYASADWFVDAALGDLHLAKAIASVQRAAKTTLDNDKDHDCEYRNDTRGTDVGADEAAKTEQAAITIEAPSPVTRYQQRWDSLSAETWRRFDSAPMESRAAIAGVVVVGAVSLLNLGVGAWLWRRNRKLEQEIKKLKGKRRSSSSLPPTLR